MGVVLARPACVSADRGRAVILCIFIYWGWDSCLAVTEETKDADNTPGKAALVSTVILLVTYVLVAVAVQAFAGFGDTGIGLANEENVDDVLSVLGEPVMGAILAAAAAAHDLDLGRLVDPDHDPADRPRHAGDGGLRRAPEAVRAGAPAVPHARRSARW